MPNLASRARFADPDLRIPAQIDGFVKSVYSLQILGEPSVPDFLFGRFLKFHIESLREALGHREFAELMRDATINQRLIAKLESGAWRTIDHHSLFVLMAAATAKGVFPLVEIVEAPFWQTFRTNNGGTALVGVDLDGHHVTADVDAASSLMKAGLSLQIVTVPEDQDPSEVKRWMRETNLLVVGGSKVNRATEICLRELWAGQGGAPVKFLWPGFTRNGDLAGPSPSGKRALELRENDSTVCLEEDAKGRHLGIVAVCREPFGSAGVTTVVIAGCSKKATTMMVEELQRPYIYYHHLPQWRPEMAGRPILFLFDSHGQAGRWRVLGFEKPKRKPGRKPGTRPRRLE